MLKEKIHYTHRLPLNVTVVNIKEYPIHFHDDLEIVFVLDGSVILKNGYYDYEMKAGDIFILNDREIHSFTRTNEDNMVLMLQFDMEYFLQHYPTLNNSFFVTDMNNPEDEDLETLRELLASAIMQANAGELGYEQKLIEISHNILVNLMENFQHFTIEDGRFVNEAKNKSNKILTGRMNRVSDYLYENYTRKLTLQEIADGEHLSIYHLSHVIKQSTGLSYKELLAFIRVEESEKLLLGSDDSISSISEAVGFSATRYYVDHFKKWFGMDPRDYRAKYKGKVSSRKTLAVMQRSNKLETGEIIKNKYPDVYYDYYKKDKVPSQVLDVDVLSIKDIDISETMLCQNLKSPEMNYVRILFNMLNSLNETVVAHGENYIATTGGHGKFLSILVINTNKDIETEEDVLLRVTGIDGKYKLKRIHIKGVDSHVSKDSKYYLREKLFNRIETIPSVETSVATAVNTLNIVLSLTGLSGELILLDKM